MLSMEKMLSRRGGKSRQEIEAAIRSAAIETLESRLLLSTTGTVAGVVYNDANGNGSQDNGEPGVAGVTVFVDLNSTGTFASGDPSAVTDSSGDYSITAVPAGSYTVFETTPSGYTQFSPENNGGIPLNIAAGQTVTNDNFGVQTVGTPPPAFIAGNVFDDVNGDGIQNNGEAGQSGVTVYLDASNTGTFQAGDPTRQTDPNGNYIFPGLEAGTYSVGIILPTGETQTLPASNANISATLTAGEADTAQNFGVTGVPTAAAGTITGVVFNDINGNQVQDANEPGLSGQTVYIDQANSGAFVTGDPTAVTDANGNYSFTGLGSQVYIVRVELAPGYSQTTPAGGMGNSADLTGANGAAGENFGLAYTPSTITGTVFNDVNQNGVQDNGEAGVSGVSVYVDLNNSGQYVSGDPMATTDANGAYTITGVTPGSYSLGEIVPIGYVQTTPASGTEIPFTVTSGQTLTSQNFALQQPPATISGTVFSDNNLNGVQDTGEPGVAGVTVFVDLNHSGQYVSGDPMATTDANGLYTITGVTPGSYSLGETVPTGYTQSTPATGAEIPFTVASAQVLTAQNFALQPPPTISGVVFNDANHDGVLDDGETGVVGVTVYEDPNYNHKLDATEQHVVTDASGAFTFTDLPADPEIIRVVLPSGYQQTFPSNGIGNYIGKNTGKTFTNENFGIYKPVVATTGSITGTVFNDLNGDHVQTSNEPNLANQTVYLDLNNDGKFDSGDISTTTNASGAFTFSGLAAGTYTVLVSPSTGYRQTLPITGGTKVTVAANKTVSAGKFGVTTTAYVGGTLFNDLNGNGVQNSGEGVLAGYKVYIDLNKDGVFESNEPSDVTTSVGYWYFRSVAPGTYTIRVVAPSGWTTTHVYTVTLTSGEMITNGSIGIKK
ncbi:MAG TPA: SdrD B-like domain-containing protein [Tepidisphaeraceae bacterium]|jgi:protocatechuate 3,4-dioxygenase beta subunit|nr:SdrD B-like domain-containing protein [Tepidisphaeraceae bacterium]